MIIYLTKLIHFGEKRFQKGESLHLLYNFKLKSSFKILFLLSLQPILKFCVAHVWAY